MIQRKKNSGKIIQEILAGWLSVYEDISGHREKTGLLRYRSVKSGELPLHTYIENMEENQNDIFVSLENLMIVLLILHL